MTIKELAKIAGLNHSTVSRSLNDSPLISEETKKRVRKLAEEYNFEPNASARSLITKRTGTIGIIFPPLTDKHRSLQYLGSLMTSLRYAIEEAQYDSIITFPKNPKTGRSNIRKLIQQRKVDGLLFVIQDIDNDDWSILQKSQLPFVSLHFEWKNNFVDQINYVYSDNFRGGYLATRCLLDAGCRDILCLTEYGGILEFTERLKGYKAALTEEGIEPDEDRIFYGQCGFEFGYNFVKEHQDLIGKIDGLFAQADMTAIGAIEAVKEMGLRVPDDIAVVGYDDIDLDNFFKPRLTTIHQPKEIHTEIACRKLIELIENDGKAEKVQMVIEPNLIVRESCVI